MKFSEWCGANPRRFPYHPDFRPDQPHHLWFGSNWQDTSGDRWTVCWAPLTGELYGRNLDWDVRPLGYIPGVEEFHTAYEGVRRLQSLPASLDLLGLIMDEASAVWDLEPAKPEVTDDLGIDL